MSNSQKLNSEKEWSFNFGIYSNDDSLIGTKKCEELMDNIVQWVEKNNFSCGGVFDVYPKNTHYDCFYDKEKWEEDEFCHCSNTPPMIMMSRFSNNPLSCLSCNGYILPEKIKIDVEATAKLQQWRGVHDSIDRLWLDSGAYELWAISELSNPNSDVNKQGFEVQKIMQKYGKTYYWWFQDIGSNINPLTDCPKCTQLLEKKDDKLICEKCLLVMQSEW